MKYLISGTNGFIGSSIAIHLMKKGQEVRSIPRDLLYNYFELKEYLELEKPDVIIHLAAYGNHSHQKDLDQIVSANIGCTCTLLQASKDIDYKAFINTSTSSVHLPRQTFYSASKKATEEICKAFSQEYKKNIISVRPFSVYGPGEADFRFIPTVIRSIKNGEEFSLAPNPTHDWIYIEDFISGVLTVVEHAGVLYEKSIDIGTGISYTNRQVVEEIEKISGEKAEYNTGVSKNYDSREWVCKDESLRSLGWKPKYTLSEGLRKTYE